MWASPLSSVERRGSRLGLFPLWVIGFALGIGLEESWLPDQVEAASSTIVRPPSHRPLGEAEGWTWTAEGRVPPGRSGCRGLRPLRGEGGQGEGEAPSPLKAAERMPSQGAFASSSRRAFHGFFAVVFLVVLSSAIWWSGGRGAGIGILAATLAAGAGLGAIERHKRERYALIEEGLVERKALLLLRLTSGSRQTPQGGKNEAEVWGWKARPSERWAATFGRSAWFGSGVLRQARGVSSEGAG